MSFGMVNIPSRLVSLEDANQEPDVIRLERTYEDLHEKMKAKREFRLHQFTQQQHFFKTADEFKSLGVPAKHIMQIHGFVESKQVNPICFNKSFVLVPDNGGEEPAAMLMDAMFEKEVTALGTIDIHNKPALFAMRSHRGMLRVDTLLPLEKIGTKANPASDVLDPKLIEALENFEESVSPTAT
jgi:non-homologous end joining protein Ku